MKRLGEYQRKMIQFAERVNGWHSYASDAVTVRTIKSLRRRGLIKTNQYQQFKIA